MHIGSQLINEFIKTELAVFINQFNISPVQYDQDKRSFCIAWLCYNFKDVINKENSDNIIDFVRKVELKDDYNFHGWYRISALQAAVFLLSSDLKYSASLIQNIDCKQSWARGFIIQCIGLISPYLHFDNYLLKKGTESNLEQINGLYLENVFLYLFTTGDIVDKQAWLNLQRDNLVNALQKTFLAKIISGEKFMKSGHFISIFNDAKCYFISYILSQVFTLKSQENLFDSIGINFKEIDAVENHHPLDRYYFDFGFLKT
jgi:hypothetical protein